MSEVEKNNCTGEMLLKTWSLESFSNECRKTSTKAITAGQMKEKYF